MNVSESFLALGLMSGTSADGVDAALIRTDGMTLIEPIGGCTVKYERSFRRRLLETATENVGLADVMQLENELTQHHAAAVQQACVGATIDVSQIDVVGFHGHTIRHFPEQRLSWQIGNGSLLAQLTGRPVVSRFRQADLAAGGEGCAAGTALSSRDRFATPYA